MALSNNSSSANTCSEMSLVSLCCGTVIDTIILPSVWQHVVIIVVLLISIILNIVTAITVCCNKRLHTVTNVFAVSLALSDICLAVVADINTIFFGFHNLTVDIHVINLQHVFIFFASFTLICNHLNHLMISIERWLYIARPFLHQRLVTTRTIVSSVITVWVIPFVFSSSLLGHFCGLQANWVRLLFSLGFSVLHFVLSAAQFSIYGHIVVITRRQTRSIKQLQVVESLGASTDIDATLAKIRSTWRQVRMFVVVFGSYFVCMTPWVCINILAFSDGRIGVYNSHAFRVSITFALFQSYSNFITHSMLDKDFKFVLKRCCGKIRCRETKVNPFHRHR